jgi:hypothetical protein
MFEEISRPPKGKGKEKDVGKRRAYVRVVTSLGGGSLNLELYCEKVGLILTRSRPPQWLTVNHRPRRHAIIFSCLQGKANTTIVSSIV